MNNEKWWTPIVRFGVHVMVGLVIFLVIAAAAIGLDVLVERLAEFGANKFTVKLLGLLADALLLTDSVCFVAHLLQSVLKAIREIFKK
ncbi:hypothetical protein [Noviherbaspirillum galbum]|uniref:Uncharacterized protein n=1 Tax=Noviherbaspirillum galbum TaxID=2709383 RepID=A0A6B3SR65_9BURK|nr:hypothetical protein [Noviherbaspirillum galbum]NEX63420.1 hypothetical protein [Noviherbaspirillum galbum]